MWDSKNKKIVLSRNATFDEASMMKPTVSQQVESIKIKEVSKRLEDDATPCSPVDSVSVRISPDVTLGENHVVVLDAKHVEERVDLIAVRRI